MGHAIQGLLKWLLRDEWRSSFDQRLELHVARACAEAGVDAEDLPEIVGEASGMLWGCVVEDVLTRDYEGRNVIDDYLKRRGWKENAPTRRYMAELRHSVMSLYEISDIVREESFRARDLIRGGEPVRVHERSGTRYLRPWDRLAARLVHLGSRFEMAGGVLHFDLDAGEEVLALLRRHVKTGRAKAGRLAREAGVSDTQPDRSDATSEVLRDSAFLFTNVWLDRFLRRRLDPNCPTTFNIDGDQIEFVTVRLPLRPGTSSAAVEGALATIPALRRESKTFWNWIDPSGAATPQSRDGIALMSVLDDGSHVLGTVELDEQTAILEANSRSRAERGRALLESALGNLAGAATIEAQTIDRLMAAGPSADVHPPSGIPVEEQRAIVHAYLERHYRGLLDQPVPMLGTTPRKSARTPKGRTKLAAWLKLIENAAARDEESPGTAYDFRWIWEELGIADLRR